MMDNQASYTSVAFATRAGICMPASTPTVRVRTLAPKTRPTGGELCPLPAGTGFPLQAWGAPVSDRRSAIVSTDSTDSMGNAYFITTRHGSHALAGTG